MHQQVVKIDRIGAEQPPLIRGVDPLHDAAELPPFAAGVAVGRDEIVLGPTDGLADGIGRDMAHVHTLVLNRGDEQLAAVVHVVNGVVFRQADERRVHSQEAGAEAVKRPQPDRLAGGQFFHAAPHFGGRFVGESQCQDLPGGDALRQ